MDVTDAGTETDLETDTEPTGSEKYGPGSYVGEEPPTGFDVKGNEDSMKFHTPESPYYGRTVAEVWFDSAAAAEAAGFTDAVHAQTQEDDAQ